LISKVVVVVEEEGSYEFWLREEALAMAWR